MGNCAFTMDRLIRKVCSRLRSIQKPLRDTKDVPRYLWAFGAGIAAGGTIGTVGWGGAQILIPTLTFSPHPLVPGLPPLAATGVALTSLSFSTLTTGYQFWKDDHVNLLVAFMIGVPAVLSARLGTLWAKKLSGPTLTLIFDIGSIILIPTHFWIQERAKERQGIRQLQERDDGSLKGAPGNNDYGDPKAFVPFVSFGLLAGTTSSLMGVGGLPLCMSFLTEMTGRDSKMLHNFDHHMVQGTAVCSMLPSILTSASSRITAIPLVTASVVCVGAAVGGSLGAKLALSLDNENLRTLYMASLFLFGGRSVYGAVKHLRHLWVARR